jgi:hypothetical protein
MLPTMVPRILSDWTLPRLTEMLDNGVFEAETFDYKEFRTEKKSEPEKQKERRDIRRDCCAFANSLGGFLVFGVTDDKSAAAKDRLVGIDKSFDFPRDFGSFPGECKPSVGWQPLNPPVDLGNGKVIHVIHIPQSWRGPHCVETEKPAEGFLFPKRTNKGNEYMNYEEVRMAFLGYYEKRIKLQLLEAELINILSTAPQLMVPVTQMATNVPLASFNLNIVETILVDTYSITHTKPEFAQTLMALRNVARIVNTQLHMFQSMSQFPLSGMEKLTEERNTNLHQVCPTIIHLAQTALRILQSILAD